MAQKETPKKRGGRSALDRTAGQWRRPFLAAFARSGNIKLSAAQAKVGRSTVYRALETDAAFREAFDEAKDDAISILEITLRAQALEGNTTALIFLLKCLDPATYNDRVQITGPNVGPVELVATMKMSDRE
jgi:hypothetical protein